MKKPLLIGVTPFEKPDVTLALALASASFFPVLHLGHHRSAALESLDELARKSTASFGICLASGQFLDLSLPEKVDLIIAPYGLKIPRKTGVRVFVQVHTLEEAQAAKTDGADALIIKGNEGAGRVAEESSFILFQRVVAEVPGIDVLVQGGVGIHTAAALIATGAAGIALDTQLALFPDCRAPKEIKAVCEKLSGNETKVIDHYRVLVRPNSPVLPTQATQDDLLRLSTSFQLDESYLPLGQDVAIAADLVGRYKKLSRLYFGFHEAIFGHLHQAKALNVISPGNALAQDLQIPYPIAQGPMTRVSDVPRFAEAVASAGALPFVALSLLKGEAARHLIRETKQLAGTKTWGVGILGFAPQELREEQLEYIKEEKPPVVLIAGGRPSQAKPLEKLGIKTFLHVPSVALLDMFLKEGAKNFVFEGRECGGHVGPLSSLVLWEKQVERLLLDEHPEQLSVFFAGGIHDSRSAAFIAVMAAPLAARGVKVGVLMGTAYLYTTEAVATGAILPKFQEQAIEQRETVLLETAPGHETRCLRSPFTDFFKTEKENLLASGLDKKEQWIALETLNVGRLRIAAKGIERQGNDLVTVGETQQFSLGMYMIGQVAALQHRIVSVLDLHRDVAEGNYRHIAQAELPSPPVADEKSLNVAIVGMACIYPGAKNLDEYWRNVVLGRDSVTEVPDERWNKELYFDPASIGADKSHSKWGGFIPEIEFDPLSFGIPPQSLAAIEPTQLLSLLVARQALEHAGYREGNFNAENVSVIIGAEGGSDLAGSYGFRAFFKQVFGEMPPEVDAVLPKMTEDSFPGILANVISGRITNRLNLGGRNFTVDAACASSLAAVDLACQELFLEKSDMVLAGGVDLHNGINDYLLFSSTHALSRKGRCATFDAEADGIALGEGIAIMVLKRHEDALRDGDTIYAVIKGIGGSSDGKSLGLTAPRKIGQVNALERAYAQAGISPSVLGLVEAHGTGTVVGDRTELSALTEMLQQSGAVPNQTHLGSVKTQIGHTKCAAGMAGLMKAALSVYHGVKPPTIHLKNPNSFYNSRTSPFAFHTETGLWTGQKRYAGVSAFGFGGTNFHAVIENGSAAAEPGSLLNAWPAELFVFRGENHEAAKLRLRAVKTLLESNDSLALKDIAFTLATESTQPVQVSLLAETSADLLRNVDLALAGTESKEWFLTKKREGKVAFLFPGQGSQRIDMARELFVVFPALRNLLTAHPAYEPVLFPNAVFDEASLKAQKERIKDTRMAQPLLGMVDLALANLLRELGIEPDMVAGHSYGELPALCFAGAFPENQLVALSEQRAKAILDSVGDDAGAMVAVSCDAETLTKIIAELPDVYAVNHNSPTQWVLAGTTPAIQKSLGILKEARLSSRPLEVACAFHSPLLADSKARYRQVLRAVAFGSPTVPVWSNTTAAEYPTDPDEIKERLSEHLAKPVRFAEEIQAMYADGARIFIEVGPGKTLTGLTKACLAADEVLLHTEDAGPNKLSHLLNTLARYIATGRALRLEKLFEGRNAQRLDLDNPEQYKKSPSLWLINGQRALPSTGKLPAHGAMPITRPIQLKGSGLPALPGQPALGAAEQMMQEYLNSMKLMVLSQRDVMMSFLGQNPVAGTGSSFHSIEPARGTLPLPESGVPALVNHRLNGHHTNGVVKIMATPVDIKTLLLRIVSDKTGYPPDMLGMDLDLEADLSIDSIKRMEIIGALRTELGGFEQGEVAEETVVEQLASVKTLTGLVDWITENAVKAGEMARPVFTAAQAAPGTEMSFSIDDLRLIILAAVSDKTGYPPDMLGMELDLEADLSIDSIKRMEIFGEIKTKLSLTSTEEEAEGMVEQVAAIKTLTGLVSWLAEKLTPETSETKTAPAASFALPEPPNPTEKNGVALNGSGKLARLSFKLTPSEPGPAEPTSVAGYRFAVTNDAGLVAPAVKSLFEQQGAQVDIVSSDVPLHGYQGLILLNLSSAPRNATILDLFSKIKMLDMAQLKWVYIVSDTTISTGQFTDVKQLRQVQGFSGFIKSLDKELDHTKCRVVSIASQLPPNQLAAIVLNEVVNPDKPSEVIYDQGIRQTRELIPAQLMTELDSSIRLDQEAVVLVLGGAQGITSELMIRFSKEYPCRYILVGRSKDILTKEVGAFSLLTSKDEIRQHLIAGGELKTPAAIEKKAAEIYKHNQIRNTIASLERNGATVAYQSLDLRNEAELSAFIAEIYQKYGRLDGVVHGAGLLEDKLFQQKTPESFERVFSTKVTPLRVLAEELRPNTQFVILFSSIASVYGNRGQTDYAAANSVLDYYASALRQRLKGKVIAINWGPWKGAGMVSASLEKEYERRGISLIPLRDGAETFVNELKYGTESQVLIMAGTAW